VSWYYPFLLIGLLCSARGAVKTRQIDLDE